MPPRKIASSTTMAVRVLDRGLLEGVDAIAHRFDAGHRGATTGKAAEENPKTHPFDGGGQRRWRDDGRWMSAAADGLHHAQRQDRQERSDEEVRGQREDQTRFQRAAEV